MMRKDEVEHHRLGYGYRSVPAVNVKVRTYPTLTLVRQVVKDYGYDANLVIGWWEAEDRDPKGWAFHAACEQGWEELSAFAREIWGSHVKVYSEGRSGGWAYVDGLYDFDSWDAIDLMRWARFARFARNLADDVPYEQVALILSNVYEPEYAELRSRILP